MRKSWALRALSSVAIAAAGVAWAADNGAGSPKAEGTGQATEKMQGDEGGSARKNGAPVTPQSQGSQAGHADSSNGLRLDQKIDRLPDSAGAQDNGAAKQDGGNATDNGSSDMTAPQNPASPPTTLFPANPKPPADPGKPGNPVTPTSARG
jgi:hypothetical protein